MTARLVLNPRKQREFISLLDIVKKKNRINELLKRKLGEVSIKAVILADLNLMRQIWLHRGWVKGCCSIR